MPRDALPYIQQVIARLEVAHSPPYLQGMDCQEALKTQMLLEMAVPQIRRDAVREVVANMKEAAYQYGDELAAGYEGAMEGLLEELEQFEVNAKD